MATGVDDDATVRANREAYSRIEIRPRRLVDSQKVDMSVRLFGATWSSPIVICPVSSQKAFHPEGILRLPAPRVPGTTCRFFPP